MVLAWPRCSHGVCSRGEELVLVPWCTGSLVEWVLVATVTVIAHAITTVRMDGDDAASREARDIRALLAEPLAFAVAAIVPFCTPSSPCGHAFDAALPLFAQILLPANLSWTAHGQVLVAMLLSVATHPGGHYAVAACRGLAQLLPAAGVMAELESDGGLEMVVAQLWKPEFCAASLAMTPRTGTAAPCEPPYARLTAVSSAAQWWLQPSPLSVLAPASVSALRTLAALSETSDVAVAAAERVLIFCLLAAVQLPTMPRADDVALRALDDPLFFPGDL